MSEILEIGERVSALLEEEYGHLDRVEVGFAVIKDGELVYGSNHKKFNRDAVSFFQDVATSVQEDYRERRRNRRKRQRSSR